MGTAGAAEPADAELVRRALAGERDAFEAIYRRYHKVVYRFARSMSGSPVLAEDVTQEVFVALIQDFSRYEPHRAGLPTYLYGVARNVTRARLRRDRRFVNLDDASGEPGPPGDPADALVLEQDLARLRRALVALPSRYREVVILCDLHDLSYVEAASALGTPVGTVRSRLHRGRNLLSERLGGNDTEPTRAAGERIVRCLV